MGISRIGQQLWDKKTAVRQFLEQNSQDWVTYGYGATKGKGGKMVKVSGLGGYEHGLEWGTQEKEQLFLEN